MATTGMFPPPDMPDSCPSETYLPSRHCDGPRVTSASTGTGIATSATSSAALTTSSATHSDDEDDHDHDEDGDDHSDAPGTASLKPSPTESYGCEPHGDHWHCKGPITAATTPTTSGATGGVTGGTVLSTTLPAMAAARYQGAGLGVAGLAAVVAAAL